MKKKDFIIICSILLFSLICALFINLVKEEGTYVEVKINGEIIEVYDININGVYQLNGGTNVLHIENNEVWIESAICPDKLCIKQGKISSVGESIICLPYRLTVRITGDNYE